MRVPLTLALMCAIATSANAQGLDSPFPAGFEPEPLRLNGESSGMSSLWSASVPPHLEWSASTWLDVGFGSVVMAVPDQGLPQRDVVHWRGDLHLAGILGLFDVAAVGLEIPIVLFQNGLDTPFTRLVLGHKDFAQGHFGDVKIFGEYRILTQRGSIPALSVALRLSLPTGAPESLNGERGGVFEPIAAATWAIGPHRISANLSWRARTEPKRIRDSILGHDLSWGAGVEYAVAIPPLAEPQLAFVELGGTLPLFDHGGPGNHATLETRVGLVQSFMTGEQSSVNVTFGVGIGLVRHPGTPLLRGIFGMGFTSEHPYVDDDGDRIPNRLDGCPRQEEDFDGWQDSDGCPEDDNDGDGIDDVEDDCPDQAEDVDDEDDWDGCPDPDIPDDDRDGYYGDDDACPDKAEDWDGFEDEDGCPEPDNDGDGLADINDLCPDAPEDKNRYEDDDGCPDRGRGARFFSIRNQQVSLFRPILFERKTAKLMAKSVPVIDQLSSLLRSRADITRFHVTLVPEKRARRWRQLAAERAKVLREQFLRRGVEEWRLRLRVVSHSPREAGELQMRVEIDKSVLTRQKARKPKKKKRRRKKRR